MLLHIVVLLSMALIVQEPPKEEKPRVIVSSAPEVVEEFEEFEEETPLDQPQTTEVSSEVVLPDAAVVADVQVVSDAADVDASAVSVEFTDFSTETAASSDLLASVGAIGGQAGGLGGRTDPKMRTKLVQAGGGSAQSEAAVEAAIKWIINHQMPDGSWSFDFTKCPSCNGNCSHPGKIQDRGGATAMALLPMLGRGYTHKEGPYKKQFEAGIGFLAALAVNGQGKAYEKGGNLYSQGLSGIALSETYAMTQDKRLQGPAQLALNYIMAAQDPVGGGWRYGPKEPGDTSAVGWQLMALKSGEMAGLTVPPETFERLEAFLDGVFVSPEKGYGYQISPGQKNFDFRPALTAEALLCRLYLGWKPDDPRITSGVALLLREAPIDFDYRRKNAYAWYYETQVCHHVGGRAWDAWNRRMQEQLVPAQVTSGREKGSWDPANDQWGYVGGRLFMTSLCACMLEVYYRHLPLYGGLGM
jgi:hypothetical protein